MTEETSSAIKNLYAVFSNYRLNPQMDASPLYDKNEVEAWNQKVSAKSLEELTGDDLWLFVGKVCYTWGELKDFKHFLPRIFELIARYESGETEAWIAFEKLNYTDWKNWKASEYEALLCYLNSLWVQLINEQDTAALWNFDELFSSIAKVHPSFRWILKQWEDSQNATSILRFCNFIEDNATELIRRNSLKQFRDNPKLTFEFINWAKSKMLPRLEEVFSSSDNEELLVKILSAVETINSTQIASDNLVQ
ncbi:hypothetical protein [Pontibacter ruber]|uniref:Uncharacterized protein n=1 Tax=Pontibacter ruber TaxID=1343895 RepID=A0ABW5D012_9BACT|nr:hypothetical protein [Pontibacter ruber]